MKVTIVSPFDPAPPPLPGLARRAHVGGVERVLGRLAQEVAARGHEVTLLCTGPGPRWERHAPGLVLRRAPRLGTLMRDPVASLEQHLPGDADVVHVPATYPFTTPSVLGAARRMGAASVLDFHFEPSPPGPLGAAAAWAYRRIGPRSYAAADVVLVRSLAYGRSAPSLRHVPSSRWRIVPNGVDTDTFHPVPAATPAHPRAPHVSPPEPGWDRGGAERPHLLVVGRLVPYKGVDVLLHALALLGPEAPSLRVVGDGPERGRLLELARRLHVDARFQGRLRDEDLPAAYRAAALTVLPSVNRQEAFGITLLESMACGTPVVASRLPGVAEVASLGGRTAEPRDPYDLARALRSALHDPTLPRGRVLAGEVAARYAWASVAEALLRAYRDALAAREGRVRTPPIPSPAAGRSEPASARGDAMQARAGPDLTPAWRAQGLQGAAAAPAAHGAQAMAEPSEGEEVAAGCGSSR